VRRRALSRGNVRTNVYQVTQTGPTKSFTYDLNGNLTGDGTKTYEWDAANRLTAVKQGGSTLASFTYDGNGRRATKTAGGTTTTYVYDGAQFLEERPSAGATKRHVYGPGIDQPLAQVSGGTTTYSVADHLGSVVRATDAAGAPTLTREYDPWGNLLAGSATSGFAFTGREWDAEVQLAYYRARYYDPKVGRFLSEDPIGFAGGDNNFYAYVRNNPVNLIDPSGLQSADLKNEYDLWKCDQDEKKCQKDPPPDFNDCLANCIERYRFSNIWTLGAHSANAAGNVATGGTGRAGFGVPAHPTSWQHWITSKAQRCWPKLAPGLGRAGKAAGRGAVVLTVAEGFYDIGLIGSCAAYCENPNRPPGGF
jgi:RHS repeat-associated protein